VWQKSWRRNMAKTQHDVRVERVVSGGQTGVDRGGLEAAMALGIEHGGWCPLGRLAEDGKIPPEFQLTETDSTEYWIRTEQNVVDSDGTLILYRESLSGGTRFTYKMTKKHSKPCFRLDLTAQVNVEQVRAWLAGHNIRVLNVAGPRESSRPGISLEARDALLIILGQT
jgi:hypothetical protein